MTYDQSTGVLERPETRADDGILSIEEAASSDAPAIADIISSSASWYEDLVEPEDMGEHRVDDAWARANFERREFFVGRIEDEVAGTISLQEVGGEHLYLGYVYLHTDHVGNGFGRDLLDFARSELERRGRRAMVLIAHPGAVWAVKAYRRYGFERVATDRDEILGWQGGWLEPYYEEGFHLFEYRLDAAA